MNNINTLEKILDDFLYILHHNKDTLMWQREEETDTNHFDYTFTVPLTQIPVVSAKTKKSCTICSRRMFYKPGQFDTPHSLAPFLLLVHNEYLYSQEKIFYNTLVNEKMSFLLQQINCLPTQFIIREVVRCHFAREDILNPLWAKNCTQHIQEDIHKFKIKGILVVGEAIRLLFPNNSHENLGQIINFCKLPTLLTPGPSRIIYMQSKGIAIMKINKEQDNILLNIKTFLDYFSNKDNTSI